MSDPVVFEIERTPTFRRVHVLLRVGLLIVISWISHPFGILWIGLPVIAAILVSGKNGRRYLDEDGPRMTAALRWLVGLLAYLALLTDRLPGGEPPAVRFEVEPSGSPTPGRALLRIVYALPSVIVLAILGFFGVIVWIVAVVLVLVSERYPQSLWRFMSALVRWEAWLLAYLASLTDRYPPFTLRASSG
jgi:hypothetical protein